MTTQERPKRVQRFGPETWEVVGGREWSLWDLWFCVVATLDHDGNLDALTESVVDALRSRGLSDRRANEAKLSHLNDLGARLREVKLAPEGLARTDVLAEKRIVQRARDKVAGRVALEGRACSPAMIDTPRRVLEHRARYGHWPSFPSAPDRFYERFRRTVERKGFVTKGQSLSVTQRLEQRLAGLDGPRRTEPDRLALYRAFHMAGLELADAADDSYGVIGGLRADAWRTYLAIDWRATGMSPGDYWRDLCELQIWEPYAMDHQDEQTWFSSVRRDEVDLIEAILVELESELRAAILDYEADAALEALAGLYLATGTRDRYVGIAGRLGSLAWQTVEALAQSQMTAGDREGAVAVYRAADREGGSDREHLRRRCAALTGVDLDEEVADR